LLTNITLFNILSILFTQSFFSREEFMKKNILLSLVLLISSTYACADYSLPQVAKDAGNYVAGLATQAGSSLLSGASYVNGKVAKITPAFVTNAANSVYTTGTNLYAQYPTQIKATAAVAATVLVGYVVYKNFCPATKRGCCEKKQN
jgi:hypothetical protein